LQKLEAINSKKVIALDYSFNVMNSRSFAQLAEYASSICLSPELEGQCKTEDGPLPWLWPRQRNVLCFSETVIYGRLTLMTTNLCPVGISVGKDDGRYCRMRRKKGVYSLVGNNNRSFPIFRDCESCTARILSPIKENISKDGKSYHRLDFTTETHDECRLVLNKYIQNKKGTTPCSPC